MNFLSQIFLGVSAVVLVATAAGLASFLPMVFLLAPFVAIPTAFVGYLLYRNNRDHSAARQAEAGLMIPRLAENHPALAFADSSSFGAFDQEQSFDMLLTMSDEDQIQSIESRDLQLLFEYMPMGHMEHSFTRTAAGWNFRFHLHSPAADFRASTYGPSPSAAFHEGKHLLQNQIRTWHHNRVNTEGLLKTSADLIAELERKDDKRKLSPTVLIVEDDVDVAMATAAAFASLGCNTVISNGKDGVHQKMSFNDIDFIVLDWILDEDLRADQIVERSSRIIDAFTDLREKFKRHQTKVITFSALNRSEVTLPQNEFFSHVGHWKKPVQYQDLTDRASELLVANGY